jgi:hypothetical protein
MRRILSLALIGLIAGCAEPNDGPNIIVDNPPNIPVQPPKIRKIDLVAATAQVYAGSVVTLDGVSLNLKADASDNPVITLALTHAIDGSPANGTALPAQVTSLGIDPNNGVGAVQFNFKPQQTGLYSITVKTTAGSTTAADALEVVPQFSVTPPAQRIYCGDQPMQITVNGVENVAPAIGFGAPSAQVSFPGGSESWTVESAQCTPVPLSSLAGMSVCNQMMVDYPGMHTSFDGLAFQHAVVSIGDPFSPPQSFDLLFEKSGAPASARDVFADAQDVPMSIAFGAGFVIDDAQGPDVSLDRRGRRPGSTRSRPLRSRAARRRPT